MFNEHIDHQDDQVLPGYPVDYGGLVTVSVYWVVVLSRASGDSLLCVPALILPHLLASSGIYTISQGSCIIYFRIMQFFQGSAGTHWHNWSCTRFPSETSDMSRWCRWLEPESGGAGFSNPGMFLFKVLPLTAATDSIVLIFLASC